MLGRREDASLDLAFSRLSDHGLLISAAGAARDGRSSFDAGGSGRTGPASRTLHSTPTPDR